MNTKIKIEKAKQKDVEGIVKVHYAAVHQTAAQYYPKEVIISWSPPRTLDQIEHFKKIIKSSDEYLVVARMNDYGIVGFGSIIPKDNELRSLYVHPEFGRRNIGTQILAFLEEKALSIGLLYLQVTASINSEFFYKKQNFKVVEYSTLKLSSGQKMACINMRKTLTT